ncbi:MAG: proline--tRNA ligase, partial [Methylococcales bacterium]|nr:proline--tRNA ligase [Methylococcales bacterium]
EIRPRFGVMRAREFLMKDAYSFHTSEECLAKTYDKMHATYCNIFTRLGLNFRPVQADTGSIGGNASHEFHVLADAGEDAIAFSTEGDFAANVELAAGTELTTTKTASGESLSKVATPNAKSIPDVSSFLNIAAEHCLKTLLVTGTEHDAVALVLRGDHELNTIKAEKHPLIAAPLTLVSDTVIQSVVGCEAGSIGPIGLDIPVIADLATNNMVDFTCGANETGQHHQNANWHTDATPTETADLRNVVEGDPSPDGKGTIKIARGIEVGHIFQLGTNYSEKMNATVNDESGRPATLTMGCYGIGVSRVVAAAIEQHHDDNGILWPTSMAPFEVVIVPINLQKSHRLQEAVEKLYTELKGLKIDVLLDDRKARPGVMFSDMELIGIPHRVVLSDRGLDAEQVEYKGRTDSDTTDIPLKGIVSHIQQQLG